MWDILQNSCPELLNNVDVKRDNNKPNFKKNTGKWFYIKEDKRDMTLKCNVGNLTRKLKLSKSKQLA